MFLIKQSKIKKNLAKKNRYCETPRWVNNAGQYINVFRNQVKKNPA